MILRTLLRSLYLKFSLLPLVRILLFSYLIFFFGCHKETDIEPCDPSKGRFIKGQHFIDSAFLDDDKKMNYLKWWQRFKERLTFTPNCIPVEKRKTLKEILDEEAEAADLSR